MWDHNIDIHPSGLLSSKIKEFRIQKRKKKKKKCFAIILKNTWTIYILYLIISLKFFLKS